MGKPHDADDDEADILNLIADVHGDAAPHQQALDAAVKVLEDGHRHAAVAMRHFERTGRTQPPTRGHMPPASRPQMSPSAAPASPGPSRAGPGAGNAARPDVAPTHVEADRSAELTQVYVPIAHAPPPAAAGHKDVGAPADVLTGRGAEFVDLGRTRTHIVPQKKPPQK